MINRKLIAALVGISLAAGSIGQVSAQTSAPEAAVPVSTMAMPAAQPSKVAQPKKIATAKHHHKLAKAGHRAHVAHAGKTARVSHLAKRGTHKHV